MNKSTIVLLSISLSILGCSSSTEQASNDVNMEKYPQKRSLDWCQKNYFSASAGAKIVRIVLNIVIHKHDNLI